MKSTKSVIPLLDSHAPSRYARAPTAFAIYMAEVRGLVNEDSRSRTTRTTRTGTQAAGPQKGHPTSGFEVKDGGVL